MKHTVIKSVLITIILVLLMSAASYALTSGSGELTLVLEHNNSPLSNISMSIVKVADAGESEKTIVYTLTSEFRGCRVNPNNLSTENNIAMSATLSGYVRNNNISVTTATTNSKGTANFKNLDPGLYLVMMQSNTRYIMTSVVIPVPIIEDDGFVNYIVIAHPKTEQIPEPPNPPEDTSNPSEEITKPPEETTKLPEETTKSPEETTKQPEETTAPIEETTGPPEEITEPPYETTAPEPITESESETLTPASTYVEGIGELTETNVPGVYVNIGDDGVPHYYMYDEDLGEWIEVDEFGVPLGSLESGSGSGAGAEELPQTGLLRWPVPVLTGSGIILTAAGLIATGRGKKRDED